MASASPSHGDHGTEGCCVPSMKQQTKILSGERTGQPVLCIWRNILVIYRMGAGGSVTIRRDYQHHLQHPWLR